MERALTASGEETLAIVSGIIELVLEPTALALVSLVIESVLSGVVLVADAVAMTEGTVRLDSTLGAEVAGTPAVSG